jgi:hypothetical protein
VKASSLSYNGGVLGLRTVWNFVHEIVWGIPDGRSAAVVVGGWWRGMKYSAE